MKIFIMGLTACGKSRQAKNIATHFSLSYISGSAMLLGKLDFSDNAIDHFWMEKEGESLNAARDQMSVDQDVDREIVEIASTLDDLAFDSWTIPWLYKGEDAIRIYLNPTLYARGCMAYKSKENKKYSLEQLMNLLDQKDQSTRARFLTLYGFDVFDTSAFDLVFDNSQLQAQETSERLIKYITDLTTE